MKTVYFNQIIWLKLQGEKRHGHCALDFPIHFTFLHIYILSRYMTSAPNIMNMMPNKFSHYLIAEKLRGNFLEN